jgi:hypothetical protein
MITANGLIQLGFTPQVDFFLQDDSDGNEVYIKKWSSSKPQPTKSEIEAAEVEWKAAYDAKAYARNRASEYPSIGDQLDMIYRNGDGGAEFQAAIKAVKDKYPKE